MSTVPDGWTVEFVAQEAPARGLRIALSSVRGRAESTSNAFFRHGLSGLGVDAALPLPHLRVELFELPTLDEAWTLYMLVRRQKGAELPEAFAAFCQYAEDARQGHWPDRVMPHQAIQAVYLAIAHDWLLRSPPNRDRFLDECFKLFDVVARKLSAGSSLLDEPLLANEPAFQKYISMLTSDRALYAEDLSRAKRFWATLPAEHSATRTERRLPLLCLERPVATQFKLWARRDDKAPGGKGYALLLVAFPDGNVVLSADPASKARVGFLGAHLTRAEAKARGLEGGGVSAQACDWYDGARHGGTIAAAPTGGTRLTLDQVVAALKEPLRLEPISDRTRKPHALQAMGAAAVLGLAALGAYGAFRLPGSGQTAGATEEISVRGAKGEPIPKAKVLNLLASQDGPRSFTHYALVAGVCGYEGDRALRAPCRDARAVRDLLVRHYGYDERNIIFMVDRPEPNERTDGVPTAANLRLQIEKFRERFGENERSSFLFYYSGHGGYEKGARKDFGVLQPAGYFEREDLPISDRGWDMQELVDGIKKGVPSRHVMIILDACYSGWAVGAKGDDHLRTEVMSLWNERAEVVLSAGTRGQRAWEDEEEPSAWVWNGHSAMTAFLLQGLTPAASATPADLNGDRVVTDEELARYLRQRVPESVKVVKRADQTPQFFRFDEHLPRSGQFLFVSPSVEPAP